MSAGESQSAGTVATRTARFSALTKTAGKFTIPAGGNLPADQLAQALGPTRAGDPLGLGFKAGERPQAPPDPDPYDPAKEEKEFCRSLLDEEGRTELEAELKRNEAEGSRFLTIDQVREIVRDHCPKSTEAAPDFTCIDAEVMMLLDQRTDYKVFIAGDNVYTREELYANFPFPEFGVQPEAMFSQQEIGVFPPKKYAMDDALEYLARDADDESVDFIMLEDMVGQAARENYQFKRQAIKIAKTKIYLARDQWADFAILQRVFRSGVRVAKAQIAYNGGTAVPPLLTMLGFGLSSGGSGRAASAPLLTDTATHEAHQQRAREENERHEARMKQMREEAETRARHLREEAELRAELFRQREAETAQRIQEDMLRVDERMAAIQAASKKRMEASVAMAEARASAMSQNPTSEGMQTFGDGAIPNGTYGSGTYGRGMPAMNGTPGHHALMPDAAPGFGGLGAAIPEFPAMPAGRGGRGMGRMANASRSLGNGGLDLGFGRGRGRQPVSPALNGEAPSSTSVDDDSVAL